MPQFYRKKNAQTGAEDFYEVGTDKYLSPTDFRTGGYSEKKNIPIDNSRIQDGLAEYSTSNMGNYQSQLSFVDLVKDAIKRRQGMNSDIRSAKNYWRTQQANPYTYTDERLQLLNPSQQQALREERYATAGAHLRTLGEEEAYRENRIEDITGSIADLQAAKTKDDEARRDAAERAASLARQARADKIDEFLKFQGTGYQVDASGNVSRDFSGVSAKQIADVIKGRESGGNYDAKGGDGENGAYQYMPRTWAGYSSEYANDVLKTSEVLPMTPENQDAVTEYKIQKWLDAGYKPEQIFSMWNSGSPDAYLQGRKGTSAGGVPYDVANYVNQSMRKLEAAVGSRKTERKSWTDASVRELATKTGIPSSQLLAMSDDELDELNSTAEGDIVQDLLKEIPARQIVSIGLKDKETLETVLTLRYVAGESDEMILEYLKDLGINVNVGSLNGKPVTVLDRLDNVINRE